MKNFIKHILAFIFRVALWFRYRVKITGLETLTPETLSKKGGVLFLPNHPAIFIDPTLVTLALWPKFPMRPMIVEYMYYHPLINPMMRFLDALPIPNFVNSSNSLKRKKSEQMVETVVKNLKEGQNFLIYPAGKTKQTGYEAIGGASAVPRILNQVPEANVVLVRTKGLWGSSFSRALTGGPPPMFHTLWEGVKHIFKNLIFFTPRRQVELVFEAAPADFPQQGTKMEINRWLEKYYNKPDHLTPQQGEEPGDSLMLVPYSLWSSALPEVSPKAACQTENLDLSHIPEDIRKKCFKKVASIAEIDPAALKGEMSLAQDLGMDSLDIAEVAAFLQDEYDVGGIPFNELTTINKVAAIASKKVAIAAEQEEETGKAKNWDLPAVERHRVYIAEGATLPEVFLNICDTYGKNPAVADLRSGTLSYSQLKMRALLVADYIRTLPGKYIGILLPSSVGAEVLILAIHFAGKIPLMVNWTVGARHLESVAKLSNVQSVLSSWAFLDRLESADLTGIDDKLIMLEDVRSQFGLKQKLKALWQSKKGAKTLMRELGLEDVKESDPAVLLFTSGTESMPKGVPLSHSNVLSNLRGLLEEIAIFNDDVLLSMLPPFHSFGFTVTGLLPLLSGIRAAFTPDPTDGRKIIKAIVRWQGTVMGGTPTFIKSIMRAASVDQLKTVRFAFTGAEKAPADLFTLMTQYEKPIDFLLEGYGITECSPVLSFNRMGETHKGVGRAAPHVELLIVHPETLAPLPLGDTGMILARGPNIFSGYINPGLDPFVEVEGKKWYKTGDLGFLDEKGALTISGRLKRFIKIGGEMFSLAGLEDAILQAGISKGWKMADQATLAIAAKEIAGEKPKITLFTILPIELEEANQGLREGGFSNLVKISQVVKIPEIPLTGTGKINYRMLEDQLDGNAQEKTVTK